MTKTAYLVVFSAYMEKKADASLQEHTDKKASVPYAKDNFSIMLFDKRKDALRPRTMSVSIGKRQSVKSEPHFRFA